MAHFVVVLGARPNVVKAAPLIHKLEEKGHHVTTIHTGQHYDDNMFGSFLRDFNLSEPDYSLGVSTADRTTRMAEVIDGVGSILRIEVPNACIVVGDVDSTLGGAMAAHLTKTPLVHLEAGLRSGDWSMPEETNRYMTDHLSSLLLTTTQKALNNLVEERMNDNPSNKIWIRFVGNTMIDALNFKDWRIKQNSYYIFRPYILCTFHRPALVDDVYEFNRLWAALMKISKDYRVFVCAHPRLPIPVNNGTYPNLHVIPPLSYEDFTIVMNDAEMVITDSGGIQEETTYLGVPCLTYRNNTERDITITHGTNTLIGMDPENLIKNVENPRRIITQEIDYWDGRASERAAIEIENWL